MLTNKTLSPPPEWRYSALGISQTYQYRTLVWFRKFGIAIRDTKSPLHTHNPRALLERFKALEQMLNSQMARLHNIKVLEVFNKTFAGTYMLRQCGISDIFEVTAHSDYGTGELFTYRISNGQPCVDGLDRSTVWACGEAIDEFTVKEVSGMRIYKPHARTLLDGTDDLDSEEPKYSLNPDTDTYIESDWDALIWLRHEYSADISRAHEEEVGSAQEVWSGDDDDDDDDDDRSDYRRPINSYHSSTLKQLDATTRRSDGLMMGFEIEVEDVYSDYNNETHHIVERMLEVSPNLKKYLNFEADGSLDRGFEMVSNYGYLEDHEANLLHLGPALAAVASKISTTEDTTGMHIHVSKSVITPLQITKMVRFMHSPQNEKMLSKFARRSSNSYCKVLLASDVEHFVKHAVKYARRLPCSERAAGFKASLRSITDKYSRLNLSKGDTLEFRMWASTSSISEIEARLQFVQGLVRYVASFSAKTLLWQEFIDWAELPCNAPDMRKFLQHVGSLGIIPKKTFHTSIRKTKKAPKSCV